jgi:uncharacterized membrane protein YfcA
MVIMNKRMLTKYATVVFLAASIGVVLLLTLTDPQNTGLFGVLLVIVAIYIFFASAIYLVYSILSQFKTRKRPQIETNNYLPLYISAILAFAPILLIILNSLGTIGIVELLLTVLFEAVVIFLVRKRTSE